MQIREWLESTESRLRGTGITTGRLDCLVLLEDETGKDRGWLLAHPELELQGSVLKKLSTKIVLRALHIPLAYVRGHTEFYGRDFLVDAYVLEPRPESENIIELLKQVAGLESQALVVDVGTGSGALAITAKLELPEAKVFGIDIDQNCLMVAEENAKILNADITFLQGNLLQPLQDLSSKVQALILLCNLPYVPDDFQINRAATHEPKLALFGGQDGLNFYRTLFDQAKTLAIRPAYILTEALPPQHEALADIAKAAGYSLKITDDFIQLFELV